METATHGSLQTALKRLLNFVGMSRAPKVIRLLLQQIIGHPPPTRHDSRYTVTVIVSARLGSQEQDLYPSSPSNSGCSLKRVLSAGCDTRASSEAERIGSSAAATAAAVNDASGGRSCP